jgi:hypothetical protein
MRSLVNMISAGHLPTDPVVIRIPYIGHLLLHCNIFLQCTIKFPLRLREFFDRVQAWLAINASTHIAWTSHEEKAGDRAGSDTITYSRVRTNTDWRR